MSISKRDWWKPEARREEKSIIILDHLPDISLYIYKNENLDLQIVMLFLLPFKKEGMQEEVSMGILKCA
jgi:hypothetical protein